MPVGDAVICPGCAEVAYIIEEEEDSMFYGATVGCDECGCTFDLISPPTRENIINIKYAVPAPKGQTEFDFIKEEVKKGKV